MTKASAQRWQELAIQGAEQQHEDDALFEESRGGHEGPFEACAHPDCVLVREASAPPAATYPIPLNAEMEQAVKDWAADDRLWTIQETVEFNLRTFARTILSKQTARGESAPSLPPEPVTTFTPLMWISMTDEQKYAEYIRVREASLPPEGWQPELRDFALMTIRRWVDEGFQIHEREYGYKGMPGLAGLIAAQVWLHACEVFRHESPTPCLCGCSRSAHHYSKETGAFTTCKACRCAAYEPGLAAPSSAPAPQKTEPQRFPSPQFPDPAKETPHD